MAAAAAAEHLGAGHAQRAVRTFDDRSAIFAQDDTQQRFAQAYIDQLNRAAVFPGPIVTTVLPKREFFPAERHHQDFLNSNPTYPYIAINDIPKVNELKRLFPGLYRYQPVLMFADGR